MDNYLDDYKISATVLNFNYLKSQGSTQKKSKCPRGANLGNIGGCCGFGCTRACAIKS